MAKRKVAENNRGFKGVWIPKEIWLDENLTVQEMVFMVEIDSLDQSKGCYASNAHFADFFGLSKSRSSEVIKQLEHKGYITTKYIYEGKEIKQRIIHVVTKYVGVRETEEGYSEKTEGSNTSLSNTSNNNSERDSQYYSIYNVQDIKRISDYKDIGWLVIRFASSYQLSKGELHPKLKRSQIVNAINTLENIDDKYSLSTNDWSELIDRYFVETSSDGNINHFTHGNELAGTIRGMLS